MFAVKKVLFPTSASVQAQSTVAPTRKSKSQSTKTAENAVSKGNKSKMGNGKKKSALVGGILADVHNRSSENRNPASRRPKRQRISKPPMLSTATESNPSTGSVLMNLGKSKSLGKSTKTVTPDAVCMDSLGIVAVQQQPPVPKKSKAINGEPLDAKPIAPVRRRASKRLMKRARRENQTRICQKSSSRNVNPVLPILGDSLIQCVTKTESSSKAPPKSLKASSLPKGDILMTLMENKPTITKKTGRTKPQRRKPTKGIPVKATANKMQKQVRKQSKKFQVEKAKKVDMSIASIVLGERTGMETKKVDMTRDSIPAKSIQAVSVDASIASIVLGERTILEKTKEDATKEAVPTNSTQAVVSPRVTSCKADEAKNDVTESETQQKSSKSASSSSDTPTPELSTAIEAIQPSETLIFCSEEVKGEQAEHLNNRNGGSISNVDSQEEQPKLADPCTKHLGRKAGDEMNVLHENRQENQRVQPYQGLKRLGSATVRAVDVLHDGSQEGQKAQPYQGMVRNGLEVEVSEVNSNVPCAEDVEEGE
ncbi:MAG: hypothetical protein SGILL_010057, partial [Bacillariaceae sp.]